MKILYVLHYFPKLSETFILNEITELIERNINVDILALRDPADKQINQEIFKYNLRQRTTYFHLPPFLNLRFGYCISPQFYKSAFKAFKYYQHGTNFKNAVRLSYYSPQYKDVDLIHSHFAHDAAITGMYISEILGKPFTFTAHAYEIFSNAHYSPERLKMLTANADMVITPSLFNKNYIMKETNCNANKIEIVRATINPNKFDNKREFKSEVQKIKLIAIGRLVEKKGFEYLIKAMRTILRTHPETSLNIIGTGELENDLIEMTNKLGLAKGINFLGSQTNERCMNEILSADIAVLPCVVAKNGDMDVCPLTLQEAMALEVPIVSTSIGSIPELIENGREGFIVAERNETALAKAIINLIENPAQREEMGKNGRDKIINEFNVKHQVTKLLNIWGSII